MAMAMAMAMMTARMAMTGPDDQAETDTRTMTRRRGHPDRGAVRTSATPPQVHPLVVPGPGGPLELRLTRYRSTTPGSAVPGAVPVLVAPGFGVSAGSYALDTVAWNLVDALGAAGRDVWLFDYRSSPALASSTTPHTLDDIATVDWPAAVAEVREVTGAESVDVVAHCLSSTALLMGLAGGAVLGVRAAVCSQATLHLRPGTLNRLKIALRLPELISLGFATVNAIPGHRWGDRIVDLVTRLVPRDRRSCRTATCNRIWTLYGPTFLHDRISGETHDAVPGFFGQSNMAMFRHAARIVRAGHAVSATGVEAYVTEAGERNLRLPLLFLSGNENRLFRPASTTATVAWLAQVRRKAGVLDASGRDPWTRRRRLAGYAHMDVFLADRAAQDVYPGLVAFLDHAER